MEFSDESFFQKCVLTLFLIAPPTVVFLRFLTAPYGKHYRKGCGPTLSPALAWFFMESPTVWLTLLVFSSGRHRSNPKALTLISVYLFHYIHRTCIYPLRFRKTPIRKSKTATSGGSGDRFPLSVALTGFCFNLLNGYLQSRWVSHYAGYEAEEGRDWWFWGRFLVGLAVFLGGMAVNVGSDLVLVSLKGKDGGYKIPRGGWFEMVSCPNYFGEIIEWLGWTVMTWSWVGLGFFSYTCANLIPRARANHMWYREKFGEDYPKSRKIVIPFLY